MIEWFFDNDSNNNDNSKYNHNSYNNDISDNIDDNNNSNNYNDYENVENNDEDNCLIFANCNVIKKGYQFCKPNRPQVHRSLIFN